MADPRYTQGLYNGEPLRLGENDYEVKDSQGKMGVVHVGERTIDIHWPGKIRENRAFNEFLQLARRDALPAWAVQVPPLMSRIRGIFEAERAEGKNPHIQVGVSGDDAFFEDLRKGTRIARKLADLREDLIRGRTLPEIFDVPAVRVKLGIEAKAASKTGAWDDGI